MKYLPSVKKIFRYGKFSYNYELIRQDRKTLSLTVAPSLQIYLKAPISATDERIEHFLQKKWLWLDKQISYFKKYQRKSSKKEFVSGESYYYLGRQYKLVIKSAEVNRVVMSKGCLVVYTTKDVYNSKYSQRLLELWYAKKTEKVFQERFEIIKERFRYKQMPSLLIRNMQKRWGSFLSNKKIILNPKLIYTSKSCIDYVLAHELCHLKYKNHNKNFYNLLEIKYPKWRKIKEKLEEVGAEIV